MYCQAGSAARSMTGRSPSMVPASRGLKIPAPIIGSAPMPAGPSRRGCLPSSSSTSRTSRSRRRTCEGGMQSSMLAWRVHEFGPPGVMAFEQVTRPVPGAGEILVKVAAAGVGPWDGWIRAGKSALPQPLPLPLGSDLSGDVFSVGSGDFDLRAGDPVYGVTNSRFVGAYAEYAVASAARIGRKPAS